jgi:hypothetical protein
VELLYSTRLTAVQLYRQDWLSRYIYASAVHSYPEKEWSGIVGRNCFLHDLTKADLVRKGVLPKKRIVGMRMLYDSKTKSGVFERAKGRCIVQGHRHAIWMWVRRAFLWILLASSGVALSAVMSMCAKLLVARDICRCSYVRLVSEFKSEVAVLLS